MLPMLANVCSNDSAVGQCLVSDYNFYKLWKDVLADTFGYKYT